MTQPYYTLTATGPRDSAEISGHDASRRNCEADTVVDSTSLVLEPRGRSLLRALTPPAREGSIPLWSQTAPGDGLAQHRPAREP